MFNIGWREILILLLIVLLLFGAKRIPELARALGQGLREFKKSVKQPAEESKGKNQNEDG